MDAYVAAQLPRSAVPSKYEKVLSHVMSNVAIGVQVYAVHQPEVAVAARGLLDQGWGWRAVSEATGIQKDTLRRRLHDAGMLAQNPPPAGAS